MVVYTQIVLPKLIADRNCKLNFPFIKESYIEGNYDLRTIIESYVNDLEFNITKRLDFLRDEYESNNIKASEKGIIGRVKGKIKEKGLNRDIELYRNALEQLTYLKSDILAEKYRGIVV